MASRSKTIEKQRVLRNVDIASAMLAVAAIFMAAVGEIYSDLLFRVGISLFISAAFIWTVGKYMLIKYYKPKKRR